MTGFTGCVAPRAVSVSLVRRPVMLGIIWTRMTVTVAYTRLVMLVACTSRCVPLWLAGLECSAFWPVWTRRTVARGVQAIGFLGDDFYEFLCSALSLAR